ncbi:MAG: hypothetical protein AAFU85_27160, partial [Planctomycetota bacterium]
MADDITIPIGAKDMATEVIESLQETTQQFTRAVTRMGDKTEKSTQKMSIGFKDLAIAGTGIGLAVKAAEAALSTLGSVFGGLSGSIDAFEQHEEAVRGLGKALELAGDSAQFDSLKDFSVEMEGVANIADEVTLGLLKQGSMLGIQGDKLEDVTKAAIGLSEATGASLEDSLRKVNETMNGNTEAFAEFLPQLRTMASDEEKLAAVMKVANNGLAQRADASTSLLGSNERLSNSWNTLAVNVGELLAPVRQLWNEGFALLADSISSSLRPAIDAASGGIKSMRPILDSLKLGFDALKDVLTVYVETAIDNWNALSSQFAIGGTLIETTAQGITVAIQWMRDRSIEAITFMGLVYQRLPETFGFVTDRIALSLVTIAEDIKHAFTV